jgi:hypothetical protein
MHAGMSHKWRFLRGLKFVLLVTLFIGVFGWVFMVLWNALIPEIFGVRALNYWQALGLLVLSRIMFGGGRGFFPGHHWKQRMQARWESMTPEEREKFRSAMRRSPWCRHADRTMTNAPAEADRNSN